MNTRNLNLVIQRMFDYGPQDYVTDINNNISIINIHDHGINSGKQLAEDSIVWSVIDTKGHNLLNLGGLSFVTRNTDELTPNTIWFKPVNNSSEMFFTNGAGIPVQITSRGAVNLTAVISGFYGDFVISAAACIFDSAGDTYAFSDSNGIANIICGNINIPTILAFNDSSFIAQTGTNLTSNIDLFPSNTILSVVNNFIVPGTTLQCINGIGTQYVASFSYNYPLYFSLYGLSQFSGLGFTNTPVVTSPTGFFEYNGVVAASDMKYLQNMHVCTNVPIDGISDTLLGVARYSGCLIQTPPVTEDLVFKSQDNIIKRIPTVTIMADNSTGDVNQGRMIEAYVEVTQYVNRNVPRVLVKAYKTSNCQFSGFDDVANYKMGVIC